MSKEDILAGYLNTIYYGHGAYGIQAASKEYFDVDAKKLTVPQAAFLATVVNNPSMYDPSEKDNRARILESLSLCPALHGRDGQHHAGGSSARTQRSCRSSPRHAANQRYGGPKGFLLKMVERELGAAGFDSSQISGGGLKITTTFDKDAQARGRRVGAEVHQAVRPGRRAVRRPELHAAIASVDVNTGEVLALYGGPDYVKNSRNWATTPRPTASTFKTYALAAGLKDGYSLSTRSMAIPGPRRATDTRYATSSATSTAARST